MHYNYIYYSDKYIRISALFGTPVRHSEIPRDIPRYPETVRDTGYYGTDYQLFTELPSMKDQNVKL